MTMAQDSTDPTGVASDQSSGKVVRARERKANAALQLRIAHAEWDEIAEIIGYPTARQAKIAVELALERELKTDESKGQMRRMAGKRLDALLRSLWIKATDPEHPDHLLANTKARELVREHADMFGYKAPTEMIMHSPVESELEAWVAEVTKESRPALEEADLFDGDVVEGEWSEAAEG